MVNRKRRKWLILLTILIFMIALVVTTLQILKIKNVEINGNEQYTEDEIKELIFNTPYTSNSLYLYWKYNYDQNYEIPFIDTVEVELISNNKVSINIYEKDIVGCIEYLSTYMYFDKDGIIVESSSNLVEGVPIISGLRFDYIVLNEKLAVSNESIFNTILNVTQMLDKHQIRPDKIYFNSNYELTLYFKDARVYLGEDVNTEEKIIKLIGIVPELEGLSGILQMAEYDESTKSITFEKD